MHHNFVQLVCSHGVTCLVITPCSVVVTVTVTLLLLCAVQLCALYSCTSLLLLLFVVANQPLSAIGSCCACAAGLIGYSRLRTATTDTVLETFILRDHAVLWR
jgi:hypothetical protein